MREYLEATFAARVIQWDEPNEDGGVTFSAYAEGEFIVAGSLALLWSALQERQGFLPLGLSPLRLAA